MAADALTVTEEQEFAELRARQETRRAEAARKEAEETARKAAEEKPKALPHTKVEAATLAQASILREKEFVCTSLTDDLRQMKTVHKEETPRTSMADATEMRTLLDPEGEIAEAAKAAYVRVFKDAWRLHIDSKAWAGVTYNSLHSCIKSLHSKKGTMAATSYKKLKPILKVLRKRAAKADS